MSDASNNALQIFQSGDVRQGLSLASDAVDQNPNDWHCHYAVGVCLRQLKQYSDACNAYENALRLDAKQPPVLLALSIARQLNSELEKSVSAAKLAIELDSDYYLAYNTLGMTRKIQGDFEKASLNYEAGAQALARSIVKKLVNRKENSSFPHVETTHNLWLPYAMKSALFTTETDGLERMLLPTSEMAERYYNSQSNDGWLWEDVIDAAEKKSRLFLPNFFGTMFFMLKNEPAFRNFLGNRSTVLMAMGDTEEAEKHLLEVDELSES
jgi:tetratricopeptide (TPR) repeat protein